MARALLGSVLLVVSVCVAVSTARAEGLDETVESVAEAVEQEGRSPWHSFTLAGSFMLVADFDTTLRIDVDDTDLGTELRLEDILGLDDEASLWRLDCSYRFNRSHMLTLSYFDVRRTGHKELTREIEIGDETFPIGASVDTELRTTILKLNYWWNLFHGENWEIGIGPGIYWMGVNAEFEGTLITPPGEDDIGVDESAKVDFPPPLLGIRGAVALTDRLRLEGSAEVLYVPLEDITGWIVNVRAGLQWDILDFAGVSLGYEYFNLGAEANVAIFTGKFSFEYHAVLGGIYLYF